MSVRTCLRALAVLLVSVVVLLPGLPATAQPASAAPAPPVSAPAGSPGTAPTAASTTTASAATYVVRPGDTLTAIARTTGTAGGWPALYAANRDALGSSPDLVRAGTELVLPVADSAQPPARPAVHAVERGDSLRAVAARLGVEGGWPALYAANRAAVGPDPDRLAVGTLLQVPAPVTAPTTGAAPAAPTAPGAGAAPDAGLGTRLGAPPVTPPAAPEDSSTAPARVPAPSPDAGTDAGSSSALPAWVLWPLALVAVLAVLALVGDPLLALLRRRAPRRARARQPQAQGPAAAGAGASLSLVPPVVELAVPDGVSGDDGPVVHVAEHPTLLVTYSPADDLVLVLLPREHRVDDVLQVARVALTERAYRAVERGLPTPLRPPAGGPVSARWAG